MFEPMSKPRVFGIDPGADFPQAFIAGLEHHLENAAPEDWARTEIWVNTRRMQRRLRLLLDQGPARLLPRIRIITDIGALISSDDIPPAVPALQRRLELAQLIRPLLSSAQNFAPRAALFDLSDSLANLMDEMQGEDVAPEKLSQLDISEHSDHWARSLAFINIIQKYFDPAASAPDQETRQRRVTEALISHWKINPPEHPVIVAGSTGSRGTTALFMRAVARLPQGALILPGFDFEMPDHAWAALSKSKNAADHPQSMFANLMRQLELAPDDVTRWAKTSAPNLARNQLLSLALRPAPVTNHWFRDGPKLQDLTAACAKITWLEAPDQRTEASAIALRLRQAVEDGETAAVITPDRNLARRISAALARWRILPDDSAGTPLALSPPGRLITLISQLMRSGLTAELLFSVLKHPLVNSANRGDHLLNTHDFELWVRKNAIPFPDAAAVLRWAEEDPQKLTWGQWVLGLLQQDWPEGEVSLASILGLHLKLAERLSAGPGATDTGTFWEDVAGREARRVLDGLQAVAEHSGPVTIFDYLSILRGVLNSGEVREFDAPHPQVLIWGTLEARVQGADLTILAGLNEGSWPEMPKPDPWLNRRMRIDAGLLPPERRIGLSAHDFQQAASCRQVWLSRSTRSDDAETIPSRWLNRLGNLLEGLPEQGPAELRSMKSRAEKWLRWAENIDEAPAIPTEPRPSPTPPQSVRPTQLSITEIKHIVRDPYTIYARHILRLRRLPPLRQLPDAAMRGTILHEIMARFVSTGPHLDRQSAEQELLKIAEQLFTLHVPWPIARRDWLARIQKFKDWFLDREAIRLALGVNIATEVQGEMDLPKLGFKIRGTADRIDRTHEGYLHIYDYKTGTIPSVKQITEFDKQLSITAEMVARGAFPKVPILPVTKTAYIGLGSDQEERMADLNADIWVELHKLIGEFLNAERGLTARRAMEKERFGSDYDHLSRFGEWDATMTPVRIDLP